MKNCIHCIYEFFIYNNGEIFHTFHRQIDVFASIFCLARPKLYTQDKMHLSNKKYILGHIRTSSGSQSKSYSTFMAVLNNF